MNAECILTLIGDQVADVAESNAKHCAFSGELDGRCLETTVKSMMITTQNPSSANAELVETKATR